MTKSEILAELDALDARIQKAIKHATRMELGAFDAELDVISVESKILAARYQELLTLLLFSGRRNNHEAVQH